MYNINNEFYNTFSDLLTLNNKSEETELKKNQSFFSVIWPSQQNNKLDLMRVKNWSSLLLKSWEQNLDNSKKLTQLKEMVSLIESENKVSIIRETLLKSSKYDFNEVENTVDNFQRIINCMRAGINNINLYPLLYPSPMHRSLAFYTEQKRRELKIEAELYKYQLNSQEFKKFVPGKNISNWKEKLIKSIISLKESEAIKCVGKVLNHIQMHEILAIARENDEIASKVFILIGALKVEELKAVLISYKLEDRSQLDGINHILRNAVLAAREKIVMNAEETDHRTLKLVPTEDCNDKLLSWFKEEFRKKRQYFVDEINAYTEKVDAVAKKLRTTLKIFEIKEADINEIKALEDGIRLSWQAILNLRILLSGILPEDSTYEEVDKEYALLLGRFENSNPAILEAINGQNNLIALEKSKQMQEILVEVEKTKDDLAKLSLLKSVKNLLADQVKILESSQSPFHGNIYDIIWQELKGWEDEEDLTQVLGALHIYQLSDYIDCKLLQNVSAEDFDLHKLQPAKLFQHAMSNLMRLGLKKGADFRKHLIFNKHLLKAFLEKKENVDVLKKNIFVNFLE